MGPVALACAVALLSAAAPARGPTFAAVVPDGGPSADAGTPAVDPARDGGRPRRAAAPAGGSAFTVTRTDGGLSALVDATKALPSLVVELRYASADNVMHRAAYPAAARCLLVRPLAEALGKAAKRLAKKGLTLKAWDCYRPLSVQWELWKVMPQRGFVADPRTGSHHNRGAAIDLTLVGPDGTELEMPCPYDTFGKAAHHRYQGATEAAKANRQLLRDAMEGAGLQRNPMEWWHYELADAVAHPLLDEPFADPPGAPPASPGR